MTEHISFTELDTDSVDSEIDLITAYMAQAEYLAAAKRGSGGIHPHDAFEIAVKHGLKPEVSRHHCNLAEARVRDEAPYEAAWHGHDMPERGWIDEL